MLFCFFLGAQVDWPGCNVCRQQLTLFAFMSEMLETAAISKVPFGCPCLLLSCGRWLGWHVQQPAGTTGYVP